MINYPGSRVYKRDPVSKRYNEIVFKSRPSQSAELNDLQSILNSRTKNYLDTLYSDGSIISGGLSSIKDSNVNLFETIVYIKGQILTIPASTVSITRVGKEIIGIYYYETLITSSDDSELRDPAIGFPNYGKIGADRVKYTVQWTKEYNQNDLNSIFYPVIELNNGTISKIYKSPQSTDELIKLLSEYDYSTNGSYIVSGLNIYYDSENTDSYSIGITSGTARVLGNKIKLSDNFINIRKATDTSNILVEPINYIEGIISYNLRHTPIKQINSISVETSISENVVHQYSLSSDALNNTPVTNIVSITQNSVTYVKDTDYVLDGDSIKWINPSNEPAASSTYTVKYTYRKNITSGYSNTSTSINLPSTITNNTIVYINYTFYISRKDNIVLDSTGGLSVLEGFPSESNPVPVDNDNNTLSIGTVLVSPNSTPSIIQSNIRVVTVEDQRYMISKIEECQYNIARLGLLFNLTSYQPTSVLKSSFVDPFYDSSMMDSGLNPQCTISDEYLGMKINWETYSISNEPIYKDYTEISVLDQDKATKQRRINEFLTTSGRSAYLTVKPDKYTFIVNKISTNLYGNSSTNTNMNVVSTDVHTVPVNTINLSASGFNPNEELIIKIGNTEYSKTADSSGELDTTVDTPSGLKSGITKISILGKSSGITANADYESVPIIQYQYIVSNPPQPVINYNTYVTNNITNVTNVTNIRNNWWVNSDPLAQTFILSEDRDITSVDIFFTIKPTTATFLIITETTVGYPDIDKAIAYCIKYPTEIELDKATKFTFDKPVSIKADTYYSIIVGCDDGTGQLHVAELGKNDLKTGELISSNVYGAGTLLQASQLRTWTPIQAEDMKFTLYGAKYSTGTKSIDIGTINISNATDIMIIPNCTIPNGTSVHSEIKFSNNEIKSFTLSSPSRISKYSGDIDVKYIMTNSDDKYSPVFYSSMLGIGTLVNPSYYISRQFSIGSGTKLFVYLTSNIPSACSVKLYYQSTDNSWIQIDTDLVNYPPTNMGDNWIENTYVVDSIPSGLINTRIKIELSTDNTLYRAYCKDLRVITV